MLTFSISYLHLNENLRTGIISTGNFNSPIIYITKFTQISNAIPRKWKQELRENRAETCTIYLDHGLTKNNYFSD